MVDRRFLVPEEARTGPPIKWPVATQRDKLAPLELGRKLHPSAVALRRSIFAEAMLEKTSARQRRRPLDWIIAAGLHLAVVGMLLAAPLFFTQAIDLEQFRATMLAAPPLPPPPPPPVMFARHDLRRTPEPTIKLAKLIAPTVVPKAIPPSSPPAPGPEMNPETFAGGVPGGIPGGAMGGVLGGVLGEAKLAPPPVAPLVSRPKGPLRVGGDVKEPRLLASVAPVYSRLLHKASVGGKVCIDAVIDEHGNVMNARALCGDPRLYPAALEAVAKWKYEPTYLNGAPVSLELTVEVNFQLN